MTKTIFYAAGNTAALGFACDFLRQQGAQLAAQPEPDVTHLLLPVPSFESDGRIRGGGVLEHILADLPEKLTVIGGNLSHPALRDYKKIDLLLDPFYLAQNAAITADCAVRIAATNLRIVLRSCPVLVIGWGRIGKCLAQILKSAGCRVTVSARKITDRSLAHALGYATICTDEIPPTLSDYRVIFNTVPALILDQFQLANCHPDCVKIDLASKPGLAGGDVIWARGLPGKDAPESSGELIGKTVVRKIKEG